jgi:hypothetical protein
MRVDRQYEPLIRGRNTPRRVWKLYVVTAGLSILFIPLISSFYEYSFYQSILAIILFYVCLYPTARYFAHNESGVPVLAILCLAYAIQFVAPIFLGASEIRLVYGETKYLDDSYVVGALILTIVGMLALQIGYYTLQSRRFSRQVPTVDLHLNKKKAVIYCLLVGVMLPVILSLRSTLSEEQNLQFSAIFTLVRNQQLVVIGILGWIVYSGQGTKWHRLLLYCVVIITTWYGLSTAFVEQSIIPITVLFVTKWLYSKRLSVLSLTAITILVLFLSPAKSSFREAAWVGSEQADTLEGGLDKPFLWIEQAVQYWGSTLGGERDITEATSSTMSRTDLIHQFAHIYSLTPSSIPYQNGSTYSYFAVSWIPRAVWPDKPQAGGANNFFAVAYGITNEEGVKKSTFGVSLIGEGYINFGPLGVVVIMALQGIILILLQVIFGGPRSGAGGQAVFLAFFVFFLNGVGTSAEIFFGNIVQNLLCSCILLAWAREKSSVRRRMRMELDHSISHAEAIQ